MRLISRMTIAFCIGTAAVVVAEHRWFSFIATQASPREQQVAQAQMTPIPGLDGGNLRPLTMPAAAPLDLGLARQVAAQGELRRPDQSSPGRSAFPQRH